VTSTKVARSSRAPEPLALLDLPWMPFYIFICFLFHFWIA